LSLFSLFLLFIAPFTAQYQHAYRNAVNTRVT